MQITNGKKFFVKKKKNITTTQKIYVCWCIGYGLGTIFLEQNDGKEEENKRDRKASDTCKK